MAKYLRHRWSHDALLHRFLVKLAYKILKFIPFRVKYFFGKRLRRHKPPYNLISPGSTVVQIGAPRDTLLAGRSRAMYFSLFVGESGSLVIIEPDPDNIAEFQRIIEAQHIKNIILVPLGAWSEKKELTIYINDSHPASNFTEGCKDYDESRMKDYRSVTIPVDSVDNIMASFGIELVDLVSVTTNGAESEIISGMEVTIKAGLSYVALARTGEHYDDMMSEKGFKRMSFDDRGFTYIRDEILINEKYK